MSFPYHQIPDGTVFASHHIYMGIAVVLGVCRVVRDDARGSEPWGLANAMYAALFAFMLTWPHVPAVGATLTVAALGAALVAVVVRHEYWRGKSVPIQAGLAVGLYIALDDALQHAFGWPMPLDVFWKVWLHDAVQTLNHALTGGML